MSGPTQKAGHMLDLVLEPSCASLIRSINIIEKQLTDCRLLVVALIYYTTITAKLAVQGVRLRNLNKFMAYGRHFSKLLRQDSQLNPLIQHSVLHLISTHQSSYVVPPRDLFHGGSLSIEEAKSQRRRAEKKWRKRGLGIHWSILVSERDRVIHLIQKCKQEHHLAKVQDLTSCKERFAATDQLLAKDTHTSLPS